MKKDTKLEFEIVKHIAVLSTSPKGWTKELNLISWNGGSAKWDIRDWSPDHEKMGRGITLTENEMTALISAAKTAGASITQ